MLRVHAVNVFEICESCFNIVFYVYIFSIWVNVLSNLHQAVLTFLFKHFIPNIPLPFVLLITMVFKTFLYDCEFN